jgi:hypothetical protein
MTLVEQLRQKAVRGETRAQAARGLGLSYEYVKEVSRRHRIPFQHGNQREQPRRPRQVSPMHALKVSGVLESLTLAERYDVLTLLRKGDYSPAEALRAIKRNDLAERFEP